MAGRGSFIESFPLSSFALDDYDELFAEKLDPLLKLRDQERVAWSGKYRPVLSDQPVYPRPYQERLPVWLAIGGTPASVIRGGCLGLPLAVAIIGGVAENMVPLIERHREAASAAAMTQPVSRLRSIPMATRRTRWTKRSETAFCHMRRPRKGAARHGAAIDRAARHESRPTRARRTCAKTRRQCLANTGIDPPPS